jgi:hypothetical protein
MTHTPLRRYGVWSGNPKGYRYKPDQCSIQVSDGTAWAAANAHQCSRKSGHGDGGMFCKQHAKLMKKG